MRRSSIRCNQNIFELEVSVKEPGLVKLTKKEASGTDGSSLKEEGFTRGVKTDLPENIESDLRPLELPRKEDRPCKRERR